MTTHPKYCSLVSALFPMCAEARESFDAWRALKDAYGHDAVRARLASARSVRARLGLPEEVFRRNGGIHGFAAQAARMDAVLAAAHSAGVAPDFLRKAKTNPHALLSLPQRMIAIEAQRLPDLGGMCVFGLADERAITDKVSAGISHAIRTWSGLDGALPLSLPTAWAATSPDTLAAIAQAASALRGEARAFPEPLRIAADTGWTNHIDTLAEEDHPAPTAFTFHSGAISLAEDGSAREDGSPFAFLALLHAASLNVAPLRLVALMADLEVSCLPPKRLLAMSGAPKDWRLRMRIYNASPTALAPTVSLGFGPEERPSGLRLRFIEA